MMITLGNKARPIAYTINALIEFEELAGIGIQTHYTELSKLKNIRILAYVGLKYGALRNGETFEHTIEEVGDWLSFTDGSLSNVMKNFTEQIGTGGATEESSEAKN